MKVLTSAVLSFSPKLTLTMRNKECNTIVSN